MPAVPEPSGFTVVIVVGLIGPEVGLIGPEVGLGGPGVGLIGPGVSDAVGLIDTTVEIVDPDPVPGTVWLFINDVDEEVAELNVGARVDAVVL